MHDLILSELLTLLKAANDGWDVIRTTVGGTQIRSRSGITINEDGSGWFAGISFSRPNQLIAILRRRADPDHGTNDLKPLCGDCGCETAACMCK